MNEQDSEFDLSDLELGKPTSYQSSYAPELLQAVPRALNRAELGIDKTQPFYGADVWNGYELSWLNAKGKPVVALMRCVVPCSSPCLVESKSFKLYLNSYNQSKFESQDLVRERLIVDLSLVAGSTIQVELFGPDDLADFSATSLPGTCIDEQDIEIDIYSLEPTLLEPVSSELDSSLASKSADSIVTETLHSHLLKSNCLITNQPDWASIVIEYTGQQVCHQALLKYLVSFRMHNEFHEQCVERIYMDMLKAFDLQRLSVQALYTRRGGLDINPFRSSDANQLAMPLRSNRQ